MGTEITGDVGVGREGLWDCINIKNSTAVTANLVMYKDGQLCGQYDCSLIVRNNVPIRQCQ